MRRGEGVCGVGCGGMRVCVWGEGVCVWETTPETP